MNLHSSLKIIGKLILFSFILGLLFIFFTIGYLFIPGAVYITHPLHMAVRSDSAPLVYILSFTPLKNQRMEHLKGGCHTPLQTALRLSSIKIIDILLDREAGFADCTINTVLHFAAYRPDLLEHLLTNRGLDPMLIDDTNKGISWLEFGASYSGYAGEYPVFSALHCLNIKEQTDIRSLEIFLDHGVDPNLKTRSNRYKNLFGSPAPLLAVAAINKTCSLPVKRLLEAGADPIEAEKALKNYFYKKKIYNPNAKHTTGMDDAMSDVIKQNIRLVKRAAEKAAEASD